MESPISEFPTQEEIPASNPIVKKNLSLLEKALIEHCTEGVEESGCHLGRRDYQVRKDGSLETLVYIVYNTRTGDIPTDWKLLKDFKDGDFSLLRTMVLEGNKDASSYHDLRLSYPSGWTPPHIFDAAVKGVIDVLQSENNWILPEKLFLVDMMNMVFRLLGEMSGVFQV